MNEIKKLNISDEFLIIKGRGKVIFKDPKEKKHITVMVDKKGRIDIHEKYEDEEEGYTSLVKKDLKILSKQLREELSKVMYRSKIDLNDPILEGTTIFIKKDKQISKIIDKISYKRRGVFFIEKEKINQEILDEIYTRIDSSKIQNTKFEKAEVFSKNGEFIGGLLHINGHYFLIKYEELESLRKAFGFP